MLRKKSAPNCTNFCGGQTHLEQKQYSGLGMDWIKMKTHTWCKVVNQIRQMMWAMLGESNNRPLSPESGARGLIHLDSNRSLDAWDLFTKISSV